MQFETDYVLPTRETDEFKGFSRKLQEFEAWKKLFYLTLACFFLSFFDCFDFEIYVPILVFYFILVIGFLCKVKYEHIKKFRYNPFDFGLK